MRSSCITHVKNEPLIIIRKSYMDFCRTIKNEKGELVVKGEPVVEAALISFFEYWHSIKLAIKEKNIISNRIAENHGDKPTQDMSLLQFHSLTELADGIMRVGSESTIKMAIKRLVEADIISRHRNPNPRYKFDNTTYYLFNPIPLQSYLDKINRIEEVNSDNVMGKSTSRQDEINQRQDESTSRQGKNTSTITETSLEITSKTSLESKTKAPPQKNILNPPFKEIVELYNNILVPLGLPNLVSLTEVRKSHINARYKNHLKTLKEWEDFFKKITESEFLLGKTPFKDGSTFKVTFDWLINESNCIKVLEGNYINKEKSKSAQVTSQAGKELRDAMSKISRCW